VENHRLVVGLEGHRGGLADSRGLLRELRDHAVLEAIFRNGPITRPEIAVVAGLSKPTVSAAIRRLEQAGLVEAAGLRPGARGRTPVAYVVSDTVGFVIGCDVGGTNVRVATSDLFGEEIAALTNRTSKGGGREVIHQIIEMVAGVIDRSAGNGRPLALGISVPGLVDQTTGFTSMAYNVTPEGDFDPAPPIRERFEIPVIVENNVNLAAVGEKWFGLARGVTTVVFIQIGAGIGMGMIVDGEIVRGAHGAAGEIAYLPLTGDPFDPRHRRHGGLEDEIAEAGILAAFAQRRSGDRHAARYADGGSAVTVEEVFALAEAGDPDARAAVENVASRLGAAIAAVCAIVDPDLVVLGGGIGSNPLLLRPVRSAAAALLPITVRIETTMLRDRAALKGALAVALQEARDALLTETGESTGSRVDSADSSH